MIAQFSSTTALDFASYFPTDYNISALSGHDVIVDLSSGEYTHLIGFGGADFLAGGEGSDTYYYYAASDVVFGEQISDTGTSGIDAILIQGIGSGLTIDLRSLLFNGIEWLVLDNTSFVKCTVNSSQLDGLSTGQSALMIGLNLAGPSELDVRMNRDNFSAAGVVSGSADDKVVIHGNSGSNLITGSKFNDTIFGVAGNDILKGGAGKDILVGGGGKDTLTGGTARDIFDFNSVKESVKGSNRDKILDFKHGQHDKIDLRDIDAKTGVGNQKFKFIGEQDFHGAKGELHYIDKGSTVIVQGDVNGDGEADFEIFVKVGSLAKGDFLL